MTETGPVTAPGVRSSWRRHGSVWFMTGVVAVLWLATRPYPGIAHDSNLYTFLALRMADPIRLDSDLFVHFGRQDRFTVFSYFYAPVLEHLGVERGVLMMTVAAQACWLVGAFSLARALTADRVQGLFAMVGLVALPSGYGVDLTFSYGEAFVTPRLFAEALSMVCLACLVRGRLRMATIAMVASAAFHPIMTVPVAGVLLLYAGARHRAWYALAATASMLFGSLAVLQIEPFARLGVRLDPEWLRLVYQREPTAFLSRWTMVDGIILVSQISLVLAMLRVVQPEHRRLLWTVSAVVAGSFMMNGVGADVLHNQLLVNMQFWRATWVLEVVVHLLVAAFLFALWSNGAEQHPFARPLLLGGVLCLFAARFVPILFVGAAFSLFWGAVYVWHTGSVVAPSRRTSLVAFTSAVVVGLTTLYALITRADAANAALDRRWTDLAGFGLCVLAITSAWRFLPFGTSTVSGGGLKYALPGAVALLFMAGLRWDQRDDWERFVEGRPGPADELASFVPEGSTFYWERAANLLWFRLRHASYYSCMQATGGMFFRGMAIEAAHRNDSFRFGKFQSEVCMRPGTTRPTRVTPAELRRACIREPQLDYIVMPDHLSELPAREWISPVQHTDYYFEGDTPVAPRVEHYYRYACVYLRSSEASDTEPLLPTSVQPAIR